MEQITIEKLLLKNHGAIQAIARLKEAIEDLDAIKKTVTPNIFIDPEFVEKQNRMLRTYRNSTVKLFELALDTTWKYVKEFLLAVHGVDRASPKDVIRSCLPQGILTVEEVSEVLDMIDDRNRAAHAYKESFADNICQKMSRYHSLLQKMLEQSKVL